MTRAELEKLADSYEKKAENDYQAYQETGLTRYNTSRRKNETLAEAFRMAAQAADEHIRLVHLRAELTGLADAAERVKFGGMSPDALVKVVLAVAKNAGVR